MSSSGTVPRGIWLLLMLIPAPSPFDNDAEGYASISLRRRVGLGERLIARKPPRGFALAAADDPKWRDLSHWRMQGFEKEKKKAPSTAGELVGG